jgi:hypothetical protein
VRDAEKAKSRREELKQYIEQVKRDNNCVCCGESDYRVLEFHHRDPSQKKFSIVSAVHNRYSLPALKREIEKCDVICASCHRKIHAVDQQYGSKKINWDYIAGWFDGEGCVTHSSTPHSFCLMFGNTDREVVLSIAEFLDIKTSLTIKTKEKEHHSDFYLIRVTEHTKVIEILINLKDRCITKYDIINDTLDKMLEDEFLVPITDEQKQYIIDNYNTYTDIYIADHLKISRTTVFKIAKQLGIYKNKRIGTRLSKGDVIE